jgi:hypothetical protein
MSHLNPQTTDAARVENAVSTYHTLSGKAQQMLMVSSATGLPFWFTFDSTGDMVGLSSVMQFCPGHYPLLINVNYPSYVNIISSGAGSTFNVYITEFY